MGTIFEVRVTAIVMKTSYPVTDVNNCLLQNLTRKVHLCWPWAPSCSHCLLPFSSSLGSSESVGEGAGRAVTRTPPWTVPPWALSDHPNCVWIGPVPGLWTSCFCMVSAHLESTDVSSHFYSPGTERFNTVHCSLRKDPEKKKNHPKSMGKSTTRPGIQYY